MPLLVERALALWRWEGEELPGTAGPPAWLDGPLASAECSVPPVWQVPEVPPEVLCTKDNKMHAGFMAAQSSFLRGGQINKTHLSGP